MKARSTQRQAVTVWFLSNCEPSVPEDTDLVTETDDYLTTETGEPIAVSVRETESAHSILERHFDVEPWPVPLVILRDVAQALPGLWSMRLPDPDLDEFTGSEDAIRARTLRLLDEEARLIRAMPLKSGIDRRHNGSTAGFIEDEEPGILTPAAAEALLRAVAAVREHVANRLYPAALALWKAAAPLRQRLSGPLDTLLDTMARASGNLVAVAAVDAGLVAIGALQYGQAISTGLAALAIVVASPKR